MRMQQGKGGGWQNLQKIFGGLADAGLACGQKAQAMSRARDLSALGWHAAVATTPAMGSSCLRVGLKSDSSVGRRGDFGGEQSCCVYTHFLKRKIKR